MNNKKNDILNTLSQKFNMPEISLSSQEIDQTVAKKIPVKFAYRYKVLPLRMENNQLVVAITDPANLHALDDLRQLLGMT